MPSTLPNWILRHCGGKQNRSILLKWIFKPPDKTGENSGEVRGQESSLGRPTTPPITPPRARWVATRNRWSELCGRPSWVEKVELEAPLRKCQLEYFNLIGKLFFFGIIPLFRWFNWLADLVSSSSLASFDEAIRLQGFGECGNSCEISILATWSAGSHTWGRWSFVLIEWSCWRN